jgi:hypothetical protein
MLSLQSRVQEESHTSARVAARSELQTFEIAQQQATIRAREDMVAGLGAREDALNRTRAELEMANVTTTAEMHCLARARDAEHRERADALRHREQALEAERTVPKALLEADTIRALSISRLEYLGDGD